MFTDIGGNIPFINIPLIKREGETERTQEEILQEQSPGRQEGADPELAGVGGQVKGPFVDSERKKG